MTSIVVWPNYEVVGRPAVWVVGDSLVTKSEGQPLIDNAAKLMGLPVVCRGVGPDKFFSDIYFAQTFGYCFAGSTLMGQNAYLALAPLLTTLISTDHYIPSVEDVATFVLRYMRRSFDAYKVRATSEALFEAALFGWCQVKNSLEIWHLLPDLQSGIWQMTAKRLSVDPGAFLYLGSYKEEASAQLRTAIESEDASSHRAPRRVVQSLIADDSYPLIGGDEQLAIVNHYGFQAYTLLRPREIGKPAAYMSYLGMELTDENTSVGQAWVGGPGMA